MTDATPTPPGAFVERSTAGSLERSPVDVLRALGFGVALVVGILLASAADDTIVGFERDLLDFLDGVSEGIIRYVVGVIQILVTFSLIGAFVWTIWRKQWRLLGYLVVVNLLCAAGGFGLEALLDRSSPPNLLDFAEQEGWFGSGDYPDVRAIANVAAVLSVATPWLTRSTRRFGWVLLLCAAAGRVLSASDVPLDLLAAMAFGGFVGALVLAVLGAPDRHPSTVEIADALGSAGWPLSRLAPASVDARGSTPYFGTAVDGGEVFVKALGREERSADLLFRLYRSLRFRNLGDERPFSSLRRMIEHEALLALKARDEGIRTPRMLAVVEVAGVNDAMALAYERIEGRSLDAVGTGELTDAVLDAVWEQVAQLRRRRIAHRDLRLANVFLATDGQPWIIDFGFSELAASDRLLANDVAQLLASSALVVGADRAVAAAVRGAGADALPDALARLQPAALAGATQTGLKEQKGLLDEVRTAAEVASGSEAPELEPIDRFSPQKLLVWGSLAAAFYLLLPQLADISGLVDEIQDMTLAWIPAIVVASVITYVGAALSFAGSVPESVPKVANFYSQLAGSFVNRVTAVKVGGMALAIRFAQKCGIDPSVAVAGAGLNAIAGVMVHVTLTVGFVLAAGSGDIGFEMPDTTTVLAAVAGVLVLSGLAMLVPAARRVFFAKAVPAMKHAVQGANDVVHSPSKLVLMFGGSAVVTLSYLVCLEFCVRAFDASMGFAAVGVVYLAGSAVGQAAPTPGGIGAIEAALAAGLTSAGMDGAAALSAVIVFRLATFWLPILPGWVCFKWLERNEYV